MCKDGIDIKNGVRALLTSNGGVHLFSYFLLFGDKRKYCKEKRLLYCYGYIRSTAGAQRASSPALTTMSCNGCLRQAALSCARIQRRHTSLYGCLLRALLISPFRSKEDKEGARFSGFAQNNGCVHGVRAYVLCLREYIYITLKNWIIHGKMRKNGVRALLISPFRSKGVRGNVKNSLALLNMT